MLGRHSPQGELFRPDNIHLDHVGRDTFYGFLARTRHRMFRDEDFAGLYRKDWGRPSVPPSQLCIALLLQAKEGVSDEEAIQRTAFDLRWKVALGIDIEDKLCAKSTLQLFRAKLVLHEEYRKVFLASVEACRREGLLKRKKLEVAIDTTPVFGRGAVKDTFNLISDAIRTVVDAVVSLKGLDRETLISEQGLGRHFGPSFKGQVELDWDDPEQKRALVGQLVADAKIALTVAKAALRGYAKDAEATAEVRRARDLLAELLLQDIDEDPEDGGGPKIKQGTKTDRVVSTTDPEMRHGRKSQTNTFNGYKAAVAVDAEHGVVLATDVLAGNAHDSEGAAELAASAGKSAKQPVDTVLGDAAYGSISTRDEITKATKGADVVAKVAPASKRKGAEFTVDDFQIDLANGVAECPAGKKSIRHERPKGTTYHRFVFSRKDCTGCPLRSKCTTAKTRARLITVSERYDEIRELRRQQRTKQFKARYRRRMKVEHRIARLVQLGVRQARYIGRAKVACQIALAAAVANLVLAARTANRCADELWAGLRTGRIAMIVSTWIERARRSPSRDSRRVQITARPLCIRPARRATSRPVF